jgi:hypothetical protein
MKMNEREEIIRFLYDTMGEDGCGVSCCESEVFEDDKGWNMRLEKFMEPWSIGKIVEEAKVSIKEYAFMGFGLS